MRLARAMALAGVCSRREAELHIRAGRVAVNGDPITEVATNVDPLSDRIEYDGTRIYLQRPTTYVLFKPVDVLCTVKDTHERTTVMDLLPDVSERLYPVGRLDQDASGVLLLTNDGDLAYRLTHPKYEVKKTYRVWVVGHPEDRDLRRLARGIVMTRGERPTAPAHVTLLRIIGDASVLRITIHEGRKHEIKRMCTRIGYPCTRLVREKFAGVTLYGLEPGESRELKFREVRRLRKLVGLEQDREDILHELDVRAAEASAAEDTAPTPEDATPAVDDAATAAEIVAPATEDTAPATDDVPPATKDISPATDDTPPVTEDTAGAAEDAAPATTPRTDAPPKNTPPKDDSRTAAPTRSRPRAPVHKRYRARPPQKPSPRRHPFGPAPAGKRPPNRRPPQST